MVTKLIKNIFLQILFFLITGSLTLFAGEVVNCNPENETGICPEDKIFHKCQITKDDGYRQKTTTGRCENVKEDINDDNEKETICKCVEDEAYNKVKLEDSSPPKNQSQSNNVEEKDDIEDTDDKKDDSKKDKKENKSKKEGKKKDSIINTDLKDVDDLLK